jgi:spermidine synthase/MFS family permease
MTLPLLNLRYLLFVVFAVSGFSGLIYESIWSHYLKLFLGHAAYAQSLVIAIFMGGMAVGSWLSSRYSSRWKNVLLGYALAEGVVGLLALIFHDTFVQFLQLAYSNIIPGLGSTTAVTAFKWMSSALLILPQSVLLGMTFPLMSAGIIRLFPVNPGSSLAILYFANSFGAAIGVLASGFWLIRLTGLPGTIMLAGVINIILALIVTALAIGKRARFAPELPAKQAAETGVASNYRLLLAVALLTGTASFMYEIGWIRMLVLVLSSSTHAFELMLSAFIFGLAFGGLWIRRRIDRISHTIRFLAYVQLAMGLLALATLPLYGYTFEFMQMIMQILNKTETAYSAFNVFSAFIAMIIMLPATFCAGMTLPLITYALLRQGHGEKSIGEVYASNTLGSIAGVFIAVHLAMPVLGLQGLITAGACIDIVLGMVLLWNITPRKERGKVSAVGAVAAAVVAASVFLLELDSYKMASGVYRLGKIIKPESADIAFHKDGKTASVDLIEYRRDDGLTVISTNGKPDAGINMAADSRHSRDEATMVMAAAVPLALNPGAKLAANIGMGSGLTSHVLLSVPWLERVDTIEIEKAMVEAARRFQPRVDLTYTDPRSHIHIDDAKTFFSSHFEHYDIIVSEPSNPWISGVSGLFSEEFYQLIKGYLSNDGILVQWLQLYEIDINLVASLLKALAGNFADYAIYASDDTNILVVAKKSGTLDAPDPEVLKQDGLAAELRRISINHPQDFALYRVAGKKTLDPFIATFTTPANSDYYPVLDQNAARSRFLQLTATELVALADAPLPVIELLERSSPQRLYTDVSDTPYLSRSRNTVRASEIRDYIVGGYDSRYLSGEVLQAVAYLSLQLADCDASAQSTFLIDHLLTLSIATLPYLTPREIAQMWDHLGLEACRDSMSLTQQTWLDLLGAVGARDGAGMARWAEKIMPGERPENLVRYGYALLAGMTGYLAQGESAGTRQLWERYAPAIYGRSQLDTLLLFAAAQSASVSGQE